MVGIDLGTTNSAIAYWDGTGARIIPNALGEPRTPSVVCIREDGTALVGTPALRNRLLDPEHTIAGVKRFIGRRYNEVFDLARSVPFPVAIGEGHLAVFPIRDRVYTPQEVSALILKSLKESAEAHLGEEVSEAVVTVPAYFGDAQREATRQAAEIAGLRVVRLLVEPTAAALAFTETFRDRDRMVAVLDLGGGTFDVSLLELVFIEGECHFEVLSEDGDGFLGGDDFDQKIVECLEGELIDRHRVRPQFDPAAKQRLVQAAVSAKEALSDANSVPIVLPYLAKTRDDWMHLDTTLTRQILEDVCAELLRRIDGPCRRALARGEIAGGRIDEVLLVGGATRIPKVRDVCECIFGRAPRTLVNAQDAVAIGAALQAGVLSGRIRDVLLLDVLSHALGIQTTEDVELMIAASTTIPTSAQLKFTTCREGQTSVEIQIVEVDMMSDGNRRPGRPLGRLALTEIPQAPRGVPVIEVKLDIDGNGVLNVTATDKATGRRSELVIKAKTGLADSDIRRMRSDLPALARS